MFPQTVVLTAFLLADPADLNQIGDHTYRVPAAVLTTRYDWNVADQLYLSYTLRDYTAQNVLRHYEKLLRMFPYSQLSRGASTLRVHAVSPTEPALFERSFDDPPRPDSIVEAAREFMSGDCGLYLDTRWDLWQFDADWQLLPSRVTLAGFAPAFDSGLEDHLRIELGIDELFLPQPQLPNHLFMARSNVRSLLHLVHELDRSFSAAERRLWTETGANFAEHLQSALAGSGVEA